VNDRKIDDEWICDYVKNLLNEGLEERYRSINAEKDEDLGFEPIMQFGIGLITPKLFPAILLVPMKLERDELRATNVHSHRVHSFSLGGFLKGDEDDVLVRKSLRYARAIDELIMDDCDLNKNVDNGQVSAVRHGDIRPKEDVIRSAGNFATSSIFANFGSSYIRVFELDFWFENLVVE